MRYLKRIIALVFRQRDDEQGATAIMFAIMFPLLLMFYSFAFDGASIQAERARLADGMNQGALAVALIDNRNETEAARQENKELLHRYLTYYLPKANILPHELDIQVLVNYAEDNTKEIKSVDYSVSGGATVHPVMVKNSNTQGNIGFNENIKIKADSGAGVVRKTLQKISYSTDYVFVVDFSGSMRSASAEPGKTRIELLHDVVAGFASAVLEDDENTTIGIVPFSVGVPIAMNKKNIAGGNEIGCSWVGKLKSEYKDVDLNFWYNKSYTSSLLSASAQRQEHDKALYEHYNNVVRLATSMSMDTMTTLVPPWCSKNRTGDPKYSCDADPRADLRNASNYNEFIQTRKAAVKLMQSSSSRNHYSIANIDTLDFAATLADNGYMFSEEAVTSYIHFPSQPSGRPFSSMCNSALASYRPNNSYLAQAMRQGFKPASYLIELTSDPAILKEFEKMEALENAGTDSNSGLLRSLPVIAKGTNPRKIIIIISDGEDQGSSRYGPLALTNKLHKDYKICNRIKEGLLKYPQGTKTTISDIYYISVVNDRSVGGRIKFWADYCVGDSNAIVATNYQQLMETLLGITQRGTINFINKHEG